jgi:glutamyl-tRNA synthetase
MAMRVTRLAPSPTGALHLGNARTFLITWAIARQNGWRILMRIEDIDGPRVKPGAGEETLEILRWLGIDWDGEPILQSRDVQHHRRAAERLAAGGHIYSCELSRRDIEAVSSAPHFGQNETVYPPSLRPLRHDPQRWSFGREANYRFATPDRAVTFHDEIGGPQCHRPIEEIGDFVVWTRQGMPSYQLAVVVDDARQGVTDVIRGDDLLPSAARQILLYEALGLRPPRWWHLPLVVGPDGRRLAKRHGDTRVSAYREAGVPAERIIGLLASWSGVLPAPEPVSAAAFADRFDVGTLPRRRTVFDERDHQWLLSGTS